LHHSGLWRQPVKMNSTSLQSHIVRNPEAEESGMISLCRGAWLTRVSQRIAIPLYWLVLFLVLQQGTFAAEKIDPTLTPSIFSPESTPAHAISHLAGFVLAITGAIFVVVFGMLVYVVIRFRRRAGDDDTEPAQIYG